MERAPAPNIRRSLAAAKVLADTGLEFMPIPILTEEDRARLTEMLNDQMDRLVEWTSGTAHKGKEEG